MPVAAVIGAQWGDEGKGSIIDLLAEKAKVVVRFSGGDNAGHTIVNPHGKFALQLVPSGIFYPDALCVIGNGVAVNPEVLFNEIDGLIKRGIKVSADNLIISDRANLIMPYHTLLDGLEEESRGGSAIGTTRKGIGPVFSDKIARLGIRMGDLLDKNAFRKRLGETLKQKNAIITKIYGAEPLSEDEMYEQFCGYAERLKPHIKETSAIIKAAIDRKENVLLEGAQGTLLDPDFGTYPFATSSSPLASGACQGAGIGPTRLDKVIGVFKAYITRVGAGPMPTDLGDDTGKLMRDRGGEFGTVSGRPRNCGWFDAVAARLSVRVNGYTSIAVTKLDVLDTVPQIKICTAYELDGKKIEHFPCTADALARCKPVYEEMPGWQTDTTNILDYEKLPEAARKYIARLEELTGCRADLICVGPDRKQTITLAPAW